MRTVQLKNSDHCPALGLGTFKAAPGTIYNTVKNALSMGYRHIDCAPVYGNQPEIGKALKETQISRDKIWITSKLWNDSHAPEDVQPAIENTLSELDIDYLDLYLMHWPVAVKKGIFLPTTAEDLIPLEILPLEKTWRAMEGLLEKGLCRHIGVSNFSVTKLKTLIATARHPPEVNQVELHPYLQQPELRDFCRQEHILLTAYSPLGSPDRPDRLREQDEPVLLQDPVILDLAETHKATPAQILLSWAMHLGLMVIPKSTSVARLEENLKADEVVLSREELGMISSLDRHRRYYSGSAWALAGSSYTLQNLWDEEQSP